MRATTVDWIQHGNMPINSVDVQPRGYRILTGGNDNKVCVWNLLPVLSRKHEAANDQAAAGDGELGGKTHQKPGKIEE